jgi:O-antigen/teichoic acid export membrane protein
MPRTVSSVLVRLWWRDAAVRRVARNALHLIGSNALQSVLGLAASVIVARALGVEDFGILALIGGYCVVVTQLLSFQSIYAVIQIGTSAREKGAMGVYLGVIRIGLWLDVLGALFAACLAVLGAWVAMRWLTGFGPVTEEHLVIIAIFSVGILTGVTGAPTAILRMRDRYDAFLWHGAVSGVARLAVTLLALLLGGGLLRFAIAGTVAVVISNLVLLSFALRELGRQNSEIPDRRADIRTTLQEYPELPRVLVNTNLTATMRMVREVDILVVGYLLDSTSAGIFRIARQIVSLVHKLADPFFHAIFPDLATVNAQSGRQAVVKLARSSSALIGAASLLLLVGFVVAGQPLIVLLLGVDYAAAYIPATLMLVGAVIWAFGHPLSPTLMVWGAYGAVLRISSVGSIIYILLIWFLTGWFGVNGAAVAYPAFYAFWVVAVAVVVIRRLRVP